jgi:hypothetical protein
MKTIKRCTLLCIFLIPFCSPAQQTSKKISRIHVHDIQFQIGVLVQGNSDGSLNDFKSLAPKSVLWNEDLSTFLQPNKYGPPATGSFSALLGFQFSDKNKKVYKTNPLLRLGINYSYGNNLKSSLTYQSNKTIDTLVSSQTGQTIYRDSVTSKEYTLNYSVEQIRFDASVIFSTNFKTRCSLFAGIGFSAGASMNTKTKIGYDHYEYTYFRYANGLAANLYGNYRGRNSSDIKTETFKNKNTFAGSVYLPLGIDIRLGRKRDFWKMIHFYYELRPGINFTPIPELRNTTNVHIQNSLGLKVEWN